jgi:ubiquinone/menaquinone biosynthesis C-methylase UbiE
MKDHWEKLLASLNYKTGEKILDVGGAMDPVPIADVVIDLGNLGLGGKSYTLLDLCSDPFPFPDKYFDICICSQTLEDLASPKLAIKEMSRVAKRGIIECPHRGPESLVSTSYNSLPKPPYSRNDVWCFGTEHHKWLIEEIDQYLCFTIKSQIYLMYHPIPKWTGPTQIQYLWKDKIDYLLMYDISPYNMHANYSNFREKYKQYWE